MSASGVIAAIKARLEGAGYSVSLFRAIDADLDQLPVVGVYFGDEGEQRDEASVVGSRMLDIDVVHVADATDISAAEIEAVVIAETLADLLAQHKSDRPERYDGACRRAEVSLLTVDTRPSESSAIVSRVRITAHY